MLVSCLRLVYVSFWKKTVKMKKQLQEYACQLLFTFYSGLISFSSFISSPSHHLSHSFHSSNSSSNSRYSGFSVLFSLSSFLASSEVALLTDRPNRRMGRLEE